MALTGEGGRLAPAVLLLEHGGGKRLLITGVNKATTKRSLKTLLQDAGAAFDCCADLGFAAADTRGNAEEAAQWARQHNYRSLIVVTTSYHMPRSLAEFGAQMPDVEAGSVSRAGRGAQSSGVANLPPPAWRIRQVPGKPGADRVPRPDRTRRRMSLYLRSALFLIWFARRFARAQCRVPAAAGLSPARHHLGGQQMGAV